MLFCEYYFDVRENKEKDLKPLMMYFEGHSRAKKIESLNFYLLIFFVLRSAVFSATRRGNF